MLLLLLPKAAHFDSPASWPSSMISWRFEISNQVHLLCFKPGSEVKSWYGELPTATN